MGFLRPISNNDSNFSKLYLHSLGILGGIFDLIEPHLNKPKMYKQFMFIYVKMELYGLIGQLFSVLFPFSVKRHVVIQ